MLVHSPVLVLRQDSPRHELFLRCQSQIKTEREAGGCMIYENIILDTEGLSFGEGLSVGYNIQS